MGLEVRLMMPVVVVVSDVEPVPSTKVLVVLVCAAVTREFGEVEEFSCEET